MHSQFPQEKAPNRVRGEVRVLREGEKSGGEEVREVEVFGKTVEGGHAQRAGCGLGVRAFGLEVEFIDRAELIERYDAGAALALRSLDQHFHSPVFSTVRRFYIYITEKIVSKQSPDPLAKEESGFQKRAYHPKGGGAHPYMG